MPNNDNDELINSILKELDSAKNDAPAAPEKPAAEAPKIHSHAARDIQPAAEIPAGAKTADDAGHTQVNMNTARLKANTQRMAAQSQLSRTARLNVPKQQNAPDKPNEQGGKKKKKKKKQRSRLPGVLILTTFIFAVSICLSLVIIAYGKDVLGIGKDDTTHLIVIPENATTDDIANMLKEDGIIKSPECFKLFSRLRKSDSSYIAGEHFVRPNMAYETIIQELTTIEEGEHDSVEVTFPEGITLYDAAYLLEQNSVCDAEDFIFYFNSGNLGFSFEDKLGTTSNLKFYRMEGYLFPDTYFFYENMDPEQVCQKIYLNFDNKMTEERYAKMNQLGLSLDQLVTFASIVQKEAATTDTMTMVASVFWNRLNHSDVFPKLESDPTSNYANDFIKPHMEVYDAATIEAYDTYKGAGLPPGAICNPGLDAIDAVLENYQSTHYFFIANIITGQTLYADTDAEHEANKAIIQQQQDEYYAAHPEETE